MAERHGSGQKPFSASNVIGLRELLDASPDIIFCCDTEGRFQWVSAAVESAVGVRASDLLGHPFTKVVPAPEREHIAHRFLRRAKHPDNSASTDVIRVEAPGGRQTWLSVRSRTALRPDGEQVIVGVARPLTDE